MNFKNDELASAGVYTYSKCPTFRNIYPAEETSFSGNDRSNNLFSGYIKGDDGANLSLLSQGMGFSSDPKSDSGFCFSARMGDPEIVVDAVVFHGMSRLHQRDGLFLQKIGVLRIRE